MTKAIRMVFFGLLLALAMIGGGCVPVQEPEMGDTGPVYFSQVEPVEANTVAPAPLPSIATALRSGHWLHGVNFPWDTYGGFGDNAWGYSGLANQGPSGFRRDSQSPNDGADRLFWARIPKWETYCLGVEVDLAGPDAGAMVYYDFSEPANRDPDYSLDLRDEILTVIAFMPKGIAGPADTPSGIMIYAIDEHWGYAQGDWVNIGHGKIDHWIKLNVPVNKMKSAPGKIFDPSHVRRIGVKVASSHEAPAKFHYQGNFYLDFFVTKYSPKISFGFSLPETRTEHELKEIEAFGSKAIRLWLWADGRAGLTFDADGLVTGVQPTFWDDLDETIRLARSSNQYVVLTLFDYSLAADLEEVEGVVTGGRADLINDPVKRASLLNNAVGPLFDHLAGSNEVAVFDLINEPEWAILEADIVMPPGKRPDIINPGGSVSLANMRTFLSEIIALHASKGLTAKQLLTVGSASPRWVGLWSGLGLDLYQFHLWAGTGQIDEGLVLNFAPPVAGKPTFIGEFSGGGDVCQFLKDARSLGYSGAFPWSYRAKDGTSPLQLGAAAQSCMLNFATTYPTEVDF